MTSALGSSPLVECAWVAGQIDDEDLVILDVRSKLGDPSAGREMFLTGHIPGARYFNVDTDFSGHAQRHGGSRPLPEPKTLAQRLREAGLSKDGRLVVYDDTTGIAAARAWWVLTHFGLRSVYVLNGGMKVWESNRGEIESGPERPRPPGDADLTVSSSGTHDIHELIRITESEDRSVTLVDARGNKAFAGEVNDPASGHVPGAINIPAASLLGLDGRMQECEELRKTLAPLSGATHVIAYCGSGVSACGLLLGMQAAGLPNGNLYPGGFSDWCSYPDLTVSRGVD